ncbi:MAG: NAD-dependent deacylase [bacterium]|nr:MAG: NAD-dependent deacylase [bacterium]
MSDAAESGRIPQEVVTRLSEAQRVAVLTGAGVSAESGIPTFRGKAGLWKNHRPEQLATPQAFRSDPALVWEWYHWRRGLVRQADPNPAHSALAEMENRIPHFVLITQNVDGLHMRAGSGNVLEMHGNINRARCCSCDNRIQLTDESGVLDCARCGSLMRPDIVWFGESLDPDILAQSYRAAGTADVFVVAGTSSVVQPAASLAFSVKEAGGFVLEINLDPTPLTGAADITVLGKAGEVLPELVKRMWENQTPGSLFQPDR